MNGTFITRNLQVAAYLVALGAPFPKTTADENDRPGVASFEFQDPSGEWLRQSKELDLSDAESDKCHVPCARLFAAQKLLLDDMHNVLGRQYPGIRRWKPITPADLYLISEVRWQQNLAHIDPKFLTARFVASARVSPLPSALVFEARSRTLACED